MFYDINQVCRKHQGLVFNEQSMVLSGTLNVDPQESDLYDVDIQFNSFPERFPKVRETGGRIPSKLDRHINSDGTCCFTTLAKESILLKKQIKSILDFVDKIVVPFLQNNSYYEINKSYKNGEYSHGISGVMESYFDILKIHDLSKVVYLLLKRLRNEKYGKNEICFCGSLKKIKNCHLHLYNDLFLIEKSIISNDLYLFSRALKG